MTKKYWFRRKLYGWGWTPCTWQGWLVIAIWAMFFIFTVKNFDHEWLKNLIFGVTETGVLIAICYKKGESPKWQWGSKK